MKTPNTLYAAVTRNALFACIFNDIRLSPKISTRRIVNVGGTRMVPHHDDMQLSSSSNMIRGRDSNMHTASEGRLILPSLPVNCFRYRHMQKKPPTTMGTSINIPNT